MTDPWFAAALEAGGHLGDDVARALLEDERHEADHALLPEIRDDAVDLRLETELLERLHADEERKD